MSDLDWRNDAACRNQDPDLFFPISTTSGPGQLQVQQAKAVCRRCNVADRCLQWALDNSQEFGVWGGMSEDERRGIKKETPAPPALTPWRACANCGGEFHSTDPTKTYCRYRCKERAMRRRQRGQVAA